MSDLEIEQTRGDVIAVVGAGAMGRGIAEAALAAGYAVILHSRREETLQSASSGIRTNHARLVERGKLVPEVGAERLARLHVTTVLGNIRLASVVVESVSEDLGRKRTVFGEIESIIGDDALIATNTSSLSIDELSTALRRPERFLGLHFFNPVPQMKLVEVIPGRRTGHDAVRRAQAVVKRLGKTEVVCKSTPGFLVNRLARPFHVEAFRLLDEGFGPPTLVDDALRLAGGFRMGPFALTDLIGQDVNFHTTRHIWEAMGYDPRYTPSLYQRSLVDSGLLGRKVGVGIYEYDKPAPPTSDCVPDGEKPDSFKGSITVYGDVGPLSSLVEAADLAAIPVKVVPATPAQGSTIGIDDGPLLRVTDGALADEVAEELGRDVVLLDLARSYTGLDFLPIAANRQISTTDRSVARSFLKRAGIARPEYIDDIPGLIVARIVACLINEAAGLVQQRVSTAEKVELAALLGVNYPVGLLAWRDELGVAWVSSVLRHLSEKLHPSRYRSTPLFTRVNEAA